jgi:Ca2+-binding RTX toxin-like protein
MARKGLGGIAAAALIAAALGAPALLADVPEPTICDQASRTVKFESVDTLRDTISARAGSGGAIIVSARGASEDDGYTREDTCPAPPAGAWRVVVLSGLGGGDTIGVQTLPKKLEAKLNGGGTVDDLDGHAGVDELRGGPSHDTLKGYEGADLFVGGSSSDEVLAGRGDDTIRVRDGGNNADAVNCGAGRDVAFVDPADRLRGCEVVNRGR